ncbi:class I SAM-dependent methyltransferase [Eikenella sp. S3360]|uniref:Class I SAM-dependent methyltransferase n=1 Tax=Eikenella glucosivorans TaxID=2766967 RepID=A0ABS0N8M7_9NEIS|nr:class I SAM-dependent methyltransferase [Eikenella glucosivorans]MBH5328630.1 class I SAM-dependent methyltransferase [Eikenella glucosivorans]
MLDNILPFAHRLLAQATPEGGTAIDATAGNGHDTLFLAQCVGARGRVYAFDIQPQALAATQARLQAAGEEDQVCLIAASHADLAEHVREPVHSIVFNCGFLPGGNKSLTTEAGSTLAALAQAVRLLRPGGLLAAVLYPGHAAGALEAEAVSAWAAELPQQEFAVLRYGFLNRRNRPPYLLAIEKHAASAAEAT